MVPFFMPSVYELDEPGLAGLGLYLDGPKVAGSNSVVL